MASDKTNPLQGNLRNGDPIDGNENGVPDHFETEVDFPSRTLDLDGDGQATNADLEPVEDVVELPSVPKSEPDRVAMVSYLADGTPDQTEDFELVGEPETDEV